MLVRTKLFRGHLGIGTRVFFSQKLSGASQNNVLEPQLPNSVELDPSWQALMKDVDMSLLKHKARMDPEELSAYHAKKIREAEVFPVESSLEGHLRALEIPSDDDLDAQEYLDVHRDSKERKSPAALFGGRRIGAVVLPYELQHAIRNVIVGEHLHLSFDSTFAETRPQTPTTTLACTAMPSDCSNKEMTTQERTNGRRTSALAIGRVKRPISIVPAMGWRLRQ